MLQVDEEKLSEAETAYANAVEQVRTLQVLIELANPQLVRTVWLMAYVKGRLDGLDAASKIFR